MEVKIYREPENETLILDEDALAEYNTLAQELGLTTMENQGQENVPSVYISLNTAMQMQLNAICPQHVDAELYKKSTIPLDVLKVLKFCKDNNMYDGYQVWYNDVDPDPMLIGWNWQSEEDRIKKYTWRKDRFLIARWGDCAMELNDLLEFGFNKLKEELLDKAHIAIDKANSVINNPDMFVRKILSNTMGDSSIDLNTSASGTIY